MGFLDRFKSGPSGPDGLTLEVVARLRALPAVEAADPRDADTVDVRWVGIDAPTTVELTELRPRWKQATGFDRIELMDAFIDGVASGPGPAAETAPVQPIEPDLVPGAAEPTPAADHPPPVTEPVAVEPEPAGWEQLRTRVLPVLRASGPGPGPECVRWSVADGVEAIVVADGAPVSPADCERWGVGELDVRAAATANLRAIDPAPDPIGAGARAWVPTAPAGYQSCWLTAPGPLLAAVGLDEGIAFAPLVGELVVVDPADAELLHSVLASTERIVGEHPDPVSPLPFRLTAGGTETWQPADDHPLASRVAALRDRLR